MTPGMLMSQRLAMSNDVPAFEKSEVAIALKRAAAPLGLSPTAYHVLDILLGLSKPEDWKDGNRPVVAISNEKLAAYVGRSERSVIRAIKQLVELQVLAYRDSPTGRRWVHRNDRGEATFAYGLDFTPSKVRYRDIKRLADDWQAELNAEREARRGVTRLSRAIVDAIQGADDDMVCAGFEEQMQEILSAGMSAQEKAQALSDLYDLLVERITESAKENEMSGNFQDTSCEPDKDVTQLSNTSSQDSCLNNRPFAKANETTLTNDAYGAEEAPEKEQAAGAGGTISQNAAGRRSNRSTGNSSGVLDAVSIALLESACGTVQDDFGLSFKTWPELLTAADVMRIGIGLSEHGYAQSCDALGRHAAAAILAMVAEKALRDPEKINSPGGYFRACCERAKEGRLALAKSLFGLAAR